MRHEIESRTGVSIPLPDFFGDAGIDTLAENIDTSLSGDRPQAENSGVALVREMEGALSYGQRALWFLYQLNPADSAYHIARAARIRGTLNVAALQRAFQALAQRHAALRTTFGVVGGEHAFYDERQRRDRAKPFDVGPGECRIPHRVNVSGQR